jgi:hypothetical protein
MPALPLSTHHASQPLSLFMQRELKAIQFERPATVAGGETAGSKGWKGEFAGFAGPKTLAATPYATKLRRHYELKNTPACMSRTLQHQHRRRTHFQGSTMLLDARQHRAAASVPENYDALSMEALHERARQDADTLAADEPLYGLDQRYGDQHAGKDTQDHFVGGEINLTDDSEWVTRLHAGAKDRYGSESINDRTASYDLVYGAEHEGKDTESHFVGLMGFKGSAEDEAELRAQREMWSKARAEQDERFRTYQEQGHMGHEQQDGKAGDTYAPGWKGSSMAMADDSNELAPAGYGAGHEGCVLPPPPLHMSLVYPCEPNQAPCPTPP